MVLENHGCFFDYSRYDFEFVGGPPATVEAFAYAKGKRSLGRLEISVEDLARLDKVLDSRRNPCPGWSSSSATIFRIEWSRDGRSYRSERFIEPATNSLWEKYTGLTFRSLLKRFSSPPGPGH